MRHLILLAFALTATLAHADPKEREGWRVHPTGTGYNDLIDRVKAATTKNRMGVVTQAGPTGAARNRGITIPGN